MNANPSLDLDHTRMAEPGLTTTDGTPGNAVPAPAPPTLLERLLGRTRSAYLGRGLILAMLLNTPGFLIIHALETGGIHAVLPGRLDARAGEMVPAEGWRQIATVTVWIILTSYAVWMTRAIRLRVLAAETLLAPLLSGGAARYRAAFGGFAAAGPPLLIAAVLAGVTYPYPVAALRQAVGPWEVAYFTAGTFVLDIVYGCAVWSYVAALWGLHRLGTQPLRMQTFAKDRVLGLRPIGALILSISLAYFGLVAILVAIAVLSPVYDQFVLLLAALTILGVVLFFLPLRGVHRQMARAKEEQVAALRLEMLSVLDSAPPTAGAVTPIAVADLWAVLVARERREALAAAKPQVEGMAVWPFDTAILRKLGTVAGSILAAAVTSYALVALERLSP